LIILTCLAACSRTEAPPEEQPMNGAVPSRKASQRGLKSLTGLYESGGGLSRLCIIERKRAGAGRFGIVIRGKGQASCAGSGSVTRERDRLRFVMSGDSECRFTARISGRTIILADAVPGGCAYYCGTGATPAAARLRQSGSNRAAAMRAKDPVGEPLCSEG
jgi:hypothetical protein